jgi:hypothetical protein
MTMVVILVISMQFLSRSARSRVHSDTYGQKWGTCVCRGLIAHPVGRGAAKEVIDHVLVQGIAEEFLADGFAPANETGAGLGSAIEGADGAVWPLGVEEWLHFFSSLLESLIVCESGYDHAAIFLNCGFENRTW